MPLGPKADNPPRFYFGWTMLGVACLATVATSPGQSFLIGLFTEPLVEELGLTKTLVSLAYLIATLSAAVPLTLVGKASDKFGPRVTMGVVASLLAIACGLMAVVFNFWSLVVGFFLLRFLGQGSLSVLAGHTVALWFERRLGLVEAVRHGSMSIAVIVLPVPVAFLINRVDWELTYVILGVLVAVLTLPTIALFFRNKPEDIGQALDNARDDDEDEAKKSAPERSQPDFTLRQSIVTRAFWTLLGVGVCSGLIGTALIFHMQALVHAAGIEDAVAAKNTAAAALIPWGAASGIGMPICGWLADKFRPRTLLTIAPALIVAAVGVAVAGTLLDWPTGYFVAMGIFGVGQAMAIASGGPAIARWFGRTHHGAIRGFTGSAMVAGTACGPIVLGASFDYAGGPLVGLLVFVGLAVPLIPAAWSLRPPTHPEADPDADPASHPDTGPLPPLDPPEEAPIEVTGDIEEGPGGEVIPLSPADAEREAAPDVTPDADDPANERDKPDTL